MLAGWAQRSPGQGRIWKGQVVGEGEKLSSKVKVYFWPEKKTKKKLNFQKNKKN